MLSYHPSHHLPHQHTLSSPLSIETEATKWRTVIADLNQRQLVEVAHAREQGHREREGDHIQDPEHLQQLQPQQQQSPPQDEAAAESDVSNSQAAAEVLLLSEQLQAVNAQLDTIRTELASQLAARDVDHAQALEMALAMQAATLAGNPPAFSCIIYTLPSKLLTQRFIDDPTSSYPLSYWLITHPHSPTNTLPRIPAPPLRPTIESGG